MCTFTCIGYVDLLSIYKRKLKQINEKKNKLITYGSGHVHHPISIFLFHTYFQNKIYRVTWFLLRHLSFNICHIREGESPVKMD